MEDDCSGPSGVGVDVFFPESGTITVPVVTRKTSGFEYEIFFALPISFSPQLKSFLRNVYFTIKNFILNLDLFFPHI